LAIANTDSVTDHDAARGMIQQAIDSFGRLDILVNVAGILRDRMIFNMAEMSGTPSSRFICAAHSTRASGRPCISASDVRRADH
jgi:NAD(P)-dependent dehydrogenase (short-subunit alcohol dehydrogenase family)